jgi:hypothetical protein
MSTKRIAASDRFAPSSRRITDEGYLVAPGILARTGIYEYRSSEIGLDGPDRVIRLYRPPEEVFAEEAMCSFDGQPITLGHPPGDIVTADNWQHLAKGDVRGIGRNADALTGTLTIRAKEAIDAIEGGMAELSNGYTYLLDATPGIAPDGTPYDGTQRQIRGNHVAIVERARGGERCRIADGAPPTPTHKGKPMTDIAKRKVLVDGLPLEVDANAAEVIDTLIRQRNEARDAAKDSDKDLKEQLDEANAKIKELTDELEELKSKAEDEDEEVEKKAADLATAIDEAKRFAPSVVTDKKNALTLRRETLKAITANDERAKAVMDAVLAGKEIGAADAAVISSALAAILAALPDQGAVPASDAMKQVGDALLGTGAAGKTAVGEANKHKGRAAFLERQRDAWKK